MSDKEYPYKEVYAKAIKNAINQAIHFVNGNVVEDIESYLIDKKEKEEK